MIGTQPLLERARHQEISLSHKMGKNAVQLAYFDDRIRNMALTGVGEVTGTTDLLPDLYSGTFAYNGGTLDTHGGRFCVSAPVARGLNGNGELRFRRRTRSGEQRYWVGRCAIEHCPGKSACAGSQAGRNNAWLEDAMDHVVSMVERNIVDTGGLVQFRTGTDRFLSECIHPPTSARHEVHAGKDGSAD